MLRSLLSLFVLQFSLSVFAEPLMVCQEEDVETSFGVVSIKLEVERKDIKSYSGTMTLAQNGKFFRIFKQDSFTLWSTYGAEVLEAEGKYFSVSEDGAEQEIQGTRFTISRMLSAESVGLVSIDFRTSEGTVGFITRGCR